MPRTSRIGGPATSLPGTVMRLWISAAFLPGLRSVESDGGKSVLPVVRSRSSLPGNPGTKRMGLLAMLDLHFGLDSAAHVEIAFHFDEARIERANEIVGDPIGHRLVKRTFIAVRPQIELQRFQLDAFLIGDVADADGGEIRLPGHRADAGELRRLEVDLVVALGVGVGKSLEISAWLCWHWSRGLAVARSRSASPRDRETSKPRNPIFSLPAPRRPPPSASGSAL